MNSASGRPTVFCVRHSLSFWLRRRPAKGVTTGNVIDGWKMLRTMTEITIRVSQFVRSHWISKRAMALCLLGLSMLLELAVGLPSAAADDALFPSTFDSSTSAISNAGISQVFGPPVTHSELRHLSPISLPPAPLTYNQASVGTSLITIAPTATGSLATMITTIGGETVLEQQQTLAQMSSEMFANTQTLGLQVGDQFQQRLTNRMVANGQFLAGTEVTQLNLNFIRGQSPTQTTGVWGQGYGLGGNVRNDGNAGAMSYNQGGILYGMDLASDETGFIGVTGGNSYVGFNDLSGSGQLTAYQVGLYGLKQNEYAYALGSANYGYDAFGSTRNVIVGGVNQTLRGDFGGHQLGSYLESGLKLDGNWVHVQPLVGLQYLYLAQQGFDESGGAAALNVSARQADSLRTSIGGRIVVHRLTGPWGAVWTPYWQGRWVAELLDNDRVINASFNGAPGGAFITHGNEIGRNYGIFGKGLQVQLNDDWSLFANYDAFFGGRIETFTVAGGAVYCW